MRHQKSFFKLSRGRRETSHLLRSLSISLVKNGRIFTTHVRAKALQRYIERIITKAKRAPSKVKAYQAIQSALGFSKEEDVLAFLKLSERFASRPGGYVRVLRAMVRKGDAAVISLVEFV